MLLRYPAQYSQPLQEGLLSLFGSPAEVVALYVSGKRHWGVTEHPRKLPVLVKRKALLLESVVAGQVVLQQVSVSLLLGQLVEV